MLKELRLDIIRTRESVKTKTGTSVSYFLINTKGNALDVMGGLLSMMNLSWSVEQSVEAEPGDPPFLYIVYTFTLSAYGML